MFGWLYGKREEDETKETETKEIETKETKETIEQMSYRMMARKVKLMEIKTNEINLTLITLKKLNEDKIELELLNGFKLDNINDAILNILDQIDDIEHDTWYNPRPPITLTPCLSPLKNNFNWKIPTIKMPLVKATPIDVKPNTRSKTKTKKP